MPSISGWANARTFGFAGQKSQNSSILAGSPPPCISRQKWNWTAACRAMRRLPMPSVCAQLRHHACDFHRRAAGLGAAIDLIAETTFLRLFVVLQAQDCVDHRHTILDRDLLERVCHRNREMLRVHRAAL